MGPHSAAGLDREVRGEQRANLRRGDVKLGEAEELLCGNDGVIVIERGFHFPHLGEERVVRRGVHVIWDLGKLTIER